MASAVWRIQLETGEAVIHKSCRERPLCEHKTEGPISGNAIDCWNTLKQYRTLQKEQPDLWKHFRDSAGSAGADISLPVLQRVGKIQARQQQTTTGANQLQQPAKRDSSPKKRNHKKKGDRKS
jgi:hypothetical protein